MENRTVSRAHSRTVWWRSETRRGEERPGWGWSKGDSEQRRRCESSTEMRRASWGCTGSRGCYTVCATAGRWCSLPRCACGGVARVRPKWRSSCRSSSSPAPSCRRTGSLGPLAVAAWTRTGTDATWLEQWRRASQATPSAGCRGGDGSSVVRIPLASYSRWSPPTELGTCSWYSKDRDSSRSPGGNRDGIESSRGVGVGPLSGSPRGSAQPDCNSHSYISGRESSTLVCQSSADRATWPSRTLRRTARGRSDEWTPSKRLSALATVVKGWEPSRSFLSSRSWDTNDGRSVDGQCRSTYHTCGSGSGSSSERSPPSRLNKDTETVWSSPCERPSWCESRGFCWRGSNG